MIFCFVQMILNNGNIKGLNCSSQEPLSFFIPLCVLGPERKSFRQMPTDVHRVQRAARSQSSYSRKQTASAARRWRQSVAQRGGVSFGTTGGTEPGRQRAPRSPRALRATQTVTATKSVHACANVTSLPSSDLRRLRMLTIQKPLKMFIMFNDPQKVFRVRTAQSCKWL